MAYKIIIDLGHVGNDSGAVFNGVKECELNNSIGGHCGNALKRCGVEIEYTTGTLQDRTVKENKYRPKAFISIHNNAGGGHGVEVFKYIRTDSKTNELATMIYEEVVKLNNGRGIKTANFHVLRETICPAVLIECAFIDTDNIEKVDTEEKRKLWGESIARGVCNWLGVPYIQEKPKEDKYYRVQIGAFKDNANAVKLENELKLKGYNTSIKYY